MRMADVELLFDYWREHPPVEDLLAAFVGFKPEPTKSAAPIPPPSAQIIALRQVAEKHIKSGQRTTVFAKL